MSSPDDLRTIHLANLPEIRTPRGGVATSLVRAILTAIVVDSDNGRYPIERADLARAVGLKGHKAHLYQILAAMTVAGLMDIGGAGRAALGFTCRRPMTVKMERLRQLARLPLCHDAPIEDPEGVALRPAPRELLALRDRVLSQLDVGLAYVGKVPRGRRDPERLRLRAAACRAIRRRWQANTGVSLCDQHLGHLLGIDANCVVHCLKAYPEPKPEPKTVEQQGAAA